MTDTTAKLAGFTPTPYVKAYDVVGFAYEAALHCIACTVARYGLAILHDDGAVYTDSEGNDVTPYFVSEWQEGEDGCDTCLSLLTY